MKKLLFLLLVFLPSCGEKVYCWECDHVVSTSAPPSWNWTSTTSKVEYCDKTEEEINEIIERYSFWSGSMRSFMQCKKE